MKQAYWVHLDARTIPVFYQSYHSWIHDEESFIREWVLGYKKPFLGICLLATALGGKVEKAKKQKLVYTRLV